MNEKAIETKLRNEVKKIGGLALKFHSPFFTGMPDRFVFLPGGKFKLVELKAPSKKPSPRQCLVHEMLRSMGFEVWVIDSISGVEEFIKSVKLIKP